MRNLAMVLTLAAALGATSTALQAQEVDDQPAARSDSGRHARCRNRRKGGRRGQGECRRAQRGRCHTAQQQSRRGTRDGNRARRNGGQRRGAGQRGQGACLVGSATNPVEAAAPAYLKRLQAALESELYAWDYYAAAARSLQGLRRFSNLTRAEANHAAAITAAITALGGSPVQQQNVAVVPPQTLEQADAHCREIERKVIAIYAQLIKDCPDEGVKQALERIQDANYRHLQVVGG